MKEKYPIYRHKTIASVAAIALPRVRQEKAAHTAGKQQERIKAAEDDARLLMLIGKGDHAAFSVLVRRHTTRFYRIAYRFTGNRVEAEDMVQMAFLKLWERPLMWEASKNVAFTTWFSRVVINLCLDHHKKKRPGLMADVTLVVDDREAHEETMIKEQRQRRMEAQIAALPERQRTALNLCFNEELSNQEAADIMGIHLKALQSLLMRAKTTLKEKLKDTI